jgi:hypothetical protein
MRLETYMKIIAKGKPDMRLVLVLLLESDTPQTHISIVNAPIIDSDQIFMIFHQIDIEEKYIPQNAEASQPPTREASSIGKFGSDMIEGIVVRNVHDSLLWCAI